MATKNSGLKALFAEKNEGLLSIYFTAGYPERDSIGTVIRELASQGVDLIEVGMPYSDPLADGPIIQSSSQRALQNGMNLERYFAQVKEVRNVVSTPLIFMGYFNSFLKFGPKQFCKKCVASGINALIIPDLPLDVYQRDYKELFEIHGLSLVFLVTPQTSETRILAIDAEHPAFIYAVSSASTTGGTAGIDAAESYLQRLQNMQLKTPILTGFNISSAEDYRRACEYTRGAIIGSAFIKSLEQKDSLSTNIHSFIKSIRP